MNGDGIGWQSQGQPGRGGVGGAHHMGSGGVGRRGMHQQNRMQPQHHGNPMQHRMMTPNYRQQPQQQQQPYLFGVQEMMDMNMMRMSEMSLNGGPPPPQVVPQQQTGMYGDLGPQGNWGAQPQPFVPQEELYDHAPPFGAPPSHNGMSNYGNSRGGYNRGMQQPNSRQNNYRPQQGYPMSMGMPHQLPPQQQQPGQYYSPQYNQAYQNVQNMQMHDNMNSSGNHSGFHISSASTTMDDYSMWTDENDEETKKKKVLRDKGLGLWGDAETSNNKPIRKWIVPEGQEEDLETALSRCQQYQKKKSNHEEQLRRRMGSDNPQIAAQAQQQLEEERNAVIKVGKRPIVACGWGDLPTDMNEKNVAELDSSIAKVWEDAPNGNNGIKSNEEQVASGLPWNLPGVAVQPTTESQRNPFFAQHMQQQQIQGNHGIFMDNTAGDCVWSNIIEPAQTNVSSLGHIGMNQLPGSSEPVDENRAKVAENLRYAVEKGHLDIGLLSLSIMPPAVLDLLSVILNKIPILDANKAELQKLLDSNRPPDVSPTADPKTWLTDSQKIEYDKLVINVVTSKIEVTDLSKKINRALADAGLPSKGLQNQSSANSMSGLQSIGIGNSLNASPAMNVDSSNQNRGVGSDAFENGPPDHCDFYDYSFLG